MVIYSAGDQLDVDATYVAWILASAGARAVYLLDGGYASGISRGGRSPNTTLPAWLRRGGSVARNFGQPLRRWMRFGRRWPGRQHAGGRAAGRAVRRVGGGAAAPRTHSRRRQPSMEGRSGETGSCGGVEVADALRIRYTAQGITPDKDIVVYCNSGTEASHVFFALKHLLGYPRVRIYAGSWSQWAERRNCR